MKLFITIALVQLVATSSYLLSSNIKYYVHKAKNNNGIKPRNTLSNDLIHYSTIINNEVESVSSSIEDVSPSNTFNWEKQWYPIAVTEITDKSRPHKLQLLGNDIVLWHDGTQWRIFEDSCPHRGVPLSEGRIEDTGELLCAYHAWRFDGQGRCTSIPQTKTPEKEAALKNNLKSCVHSYPTIEKQGLVWVWGEKGLPGSDVALEAALKSPQLIEEYEDPQYEGKILPHSYNSRDLPYGWDMFMENTLDPAHVTVSHHGIVGDRYTGPTFLNMSVATSRTEIPVSEGGSFNPNYPGDVGFCQRIENPAIGNTKSYSFNDFRPPCLNKIETINPDGSKLILALYATPTMPGYCRHIGSQILIKNKDNKIPKGLGFYALPMPTWLLHITASLFLHQDQVFLHQQERSLYHTSEYIFGNGFTNLKNDPQSYSKKYFTPNEHDMGIANLRQWIYKKANGGPNWGGAALAAGLPKVLPPAQLFDVYEAHTKSCTYCQKALKNMKIIRNSALVGLAVTAVLFKTVVFRPVISAVLGSVCGAAALVTHKLMKLFYKLEYSHQDNN